MSATSIESISEFLLHAGTDFRIFDMGRGIYPVETQAFLDMENGQLAPPRPRQQHGWFAVVFWDRQATTQHYIWFVKLPVDERGLIVSATRNHFLQIIVDALGESLTDDSDGAQQLPDNPYSFVPTQAQMAQFNALVRKHLAQPMSQGTDAVHQYLTAPQQHDWQSLPLQAIADVAVRLDKTPELITAVRDNFEQYSPDFQNALMEYVESIALPDALVNCFMARAQDPMIIHLSALRALTTTQADPQLQDMLSALLERDDQLSIDVVSVIAGRHYMQFDTALTLKFFDRVAWLDDKQQLNGALFSGLFSDLVQLPPLRPTMLGMLRSEERSARLQAAIGKLFTQTREQAQ
ncbi:DUF3549 family protein [Alteromonas halophila]|uniref:DUF3549 family protein n=1 Tax=Alteromonas halophila TaxID=516698 RepID=A0A918JDA0_9ALTE|nr:DUF3549 family protein [Alteromonas halophila]GGW73119.1 hypothetical protein GCM10007391_00820 [Alteromonas halophila]